MTVGNRIVIVGGGTSAVFTFTLSYPGAVRTLAVVCASLALLAAGCGGGSSTSGQSHSVAQVSKAFFDANLAFTSEVVSNRWISGGQQIFLPLDSNKSDLRYNVQAELSATNTTTHTGLSSGCSTPTSTPMPRSRRFR